MGKALSRGKKKGADATPRGPAVVSGRRLTLAQRERLAEAEDLAAGTWRDRQRAAWIIRQVEAELAGARTGSAVERGIEDTLRRAQDRGETFVVETVDVGEWRRNEDGGLARRDGQPILDVQTVRRASRIDGLANLHKSGALNDDQKQIGDAYGQIFDKAKPPVSVSEYGSTTVGFKDVGRMLVSVVEAGNALAVISEIRRRIADARTADVLEAVAGRRATIRSLGCGGDLNTANRDRLVRGLAVAKEVLSDLNKRRLPNQER
jgi:hypothetical protein